MTLQLTEEQRRAIEATAESPTHVVVGGKEYVLIRLETYEQVKAMLEAEEIDPSLYEFDAVPNP